MALTSHFPTHAAKGTRAGEGYRIRTLTPEDLGQALRKGVADFQAMPSHLVFIAAIYPIGAFLLAELTYSLDLLPMFFPLVAGFALIGPFVALGLYEISRRRERGEEPRWRHVIDIWRSPSRGSILFLGWLLLAIFAAWLAAADWLYTHLMGSEPVGSIRQFLTRIFTTDAGWALIVFGHAIGFCFAALAFALSVVSFPMLLDRPVGAATAIEASIRTVRYNPWTMALWAAIIAAGLIAGSALLFVGLVLALPILAHASWHVYRRAVVWERQAN